MLSKQAEQCPSMGTSLRIISGSGDASQQVSHHVCVDTWMQLDICLQRLLTCDQAIPPDFGLMMSIDGLGIFLQDIGQACLDGSLVRIS